MTDVHAFAALARAHALLVAHRPQDALAELSTLPAGDAIGPVASRLRAGALLDLDRWADAAQAARAGLEAGPDPELLRVVGVAERELGRLDIAERAFLDGLALAPTDVGLLCGYAGVCLGANQPDKAAKLVARAAEHAPGAPAVYAARVHVAHVRGDDKAAQRISREFVAEHPEHPVAHALHGWSSAVRGQFSQGYSGMRQAAAAEPSVQTYAESALELRIARHPLMLPLRPSLRFGSLKTWAAAIVIIFGLRALGLDAVAGVLAVAWLALCIYSWVVPPLLARWMKRRFS